MEKASYAKIETVIVETKNSITMSQVVHELTMDQLKREERITERHMRLEKGKEQYNLTHYTPRFNGMMG